MKGRDHEHSWRQDAGLQGWRTVAQARLQPTSDVARGAEPAPAPVTASQGQHILIGRRQQQQSPSPAAPPLHPSMDEVNLLAKMPAPIPSLSAVGHPWMARRVASAPKCKAFGCANQLGEAQTQQQQQQQQAGVVKASGCIRWGPLHSQAVASGGVQPHQLHWLNTAPSAGWDQLVRVQAAKLAAAPCTFLLHASKMTSRERKRATPASEHLGGYLLFLGK